MRTKNNEQATAGVTRQEFEEAMELYTYAEQRELRIGKDVEAAVQQVVSRHKDALERLAALKRTAFGVAHGYCAHNKEALFGQRRSIGTVHGIAGYRLGNPHLKLAKGNTWARVLEEMKEKLPAYVRISEEPARNLLVADRHTEQLAPRLAELGVEVVQDELFYIEARMAA